MPKHPKENPPEDAGLGDLSENDFKALLDAVEDSQILQDRKRFLQPGALNMFMHYKQPEPDLDCLPPFYRKMILRKAAFKDESDFYGAIKVMRQIHQIFALLLRPYFVASMVALKQPGHMHEFAASMEKDLGPLLTVDPEDLPLLVHTQTHTPPLSIEPEFLELIPEMRRWGKERMPLRTLLLLCYLFRVGGHTPFIDWLERPNMVLGGDSPIETLATCSWIEVGNLAEQLLAGSPTPSQTCADEDETS